MAKKNDRLRTLSGDNNPALDPGRKRARHRQSPLQAGRSRKKADRVVKGVDGIQGQTLGIREEDPSGRYVREGVSGCGEKRENTFRPTIQETAVKLALLEDDLENSQHKWWQIRKQLNGKFWVVMFFLLALFFVSSSMYYKQSQSVTLGQLQDWRQETTETWKSTLEQMDRIESRQIRSITMLEAILAQSVISKSSSKKGD